MFRHGGSPQPKKPRTNNGVEAWNNQFSKVIHEKKPDIYKLVQTLQKEQSPQEQNFYEELHTTLILPKQLKLAMSTKDRTFLI